MCDFKIDSIDDSGGCPICFRVLAIGQDKYGDGRFESCIVLFESDRVVKAEAFLAIIEAAENLAL